MHNCAFDWQLMAPMVGWLRHRLIMEEEAFWNVQTQRVCLDFSVFCKMQKFFVLPCDKKTKQGDNLLDYLFLNIVVFCITLFLHSNINFTLNFHLTQQGSSNSLCVFGLGLK